MIKHSISIRGHRTSISLEAPFWKELNQIARHRGISTSALITEIDENRSNAIASGSSAGGLSSAIRIYVLETLKAAITGDC